MNLQKLISACTSPSSASIPSMFNISRRISGQSVTSTSCPPSLALSSSYPKLNAWVKHLYWEIPGFKETTNFFHIKRHYMMSHTSVHTGLKLAENRSIHTVLSAQDLFRISNRCESIETSRVTWGHQDYSGDDAYENFLSTYSSQNAEIKEYSVITRRLLTRLTINHVLERGGPAWS